MFKIYQKTIIVSIAIISTAIGLFLMSAPSSLMPDTVAHVEIGNGVYSTAKSLKANGIIRSPFMFHVLVKIFWGEKSIKAGDYLIDLPTNAVSLAKRMVNGEYGFTARKITFPEGTSVREMADILAKNLIKFDKIKFIQLASEQEGYLFPDTYLFMPTATSGDIITKMTQTFEERLKEINQSVAAFNKPLREIITMASIIEEEANSEESRRIISGILWKRIELYMPLQVDAPFVYIMNKGTVDLTREDLKIDSPYNTYRYRGLPVGPITNPGIDAILAAVTPEKSPYLYFLTDDDGKMHYAKNYSDHLLLKNKYLR